MTGPSSLESGTAATVETDKSENGGSSSSSSGGGTMPSDTDVSHFPKAVTRLYRTSSINYHQIFLITDTII